MNRLLLFKTGDILNIIRDAFNSTEEIYVTDKKNLVEKYTIETKDVYEDDEHYLDVVIFESSEHFPYQSCDVVDNINNKFRIKIECIN